MKVFSNNCPRLDRLSNLFGKLEMESGKEKLQPNARIEIINQRTRSGSAKTKVLFPAMPKAKQSTIPGYFPCSPRYAKDGGVVENMSKSELVEFETNKAWSAGKWSCFVFGIY